LSGEFRDAEEIMKETGKEKSRDASVTVGELVAEDYRVAGVFEKVGIDFCCGGKVALSEACREKGVSPEDILHQIEAVKSAPLDRGRDYAAWTLSFLADYIVNTHHAYLRENMEQIAAYARKVAGVHGANHPEVVDISKIFDKIVTDMSVHLREEEEVFFPAVKRIEAAVTDGAKPDAKDIAAIRDGLGKLGAEHEEIGDAIHEIRFLSKDYEIPGDACNTYMLTYRKLREFEDDLHRHVHLENNILFPKAAALRDSIYGKR
jgi:regulator of cell morphogenesis and NO signaling